MDGWTLVLVSALVGVRVQPVGTISMQNKDACLAALESINSESGRAIGGFCVEQQTGVVVTLPTVPASRSRQRRPTVPATPGR
jgi:hypothetical protein